MQIDLKKVTAKRLVRELKARSRRLPGVGDRIRKVTREKGKLEGQMMGRLELLGYYKPQAGR